MLCAFSLPWLRRARWLAPLVLAWVCAAVLAPTLTRLLQSAAGVPVWQVVCSSSHAHQAVRLMRVDHGGDESRAALYAAQDDCPLCALQHANWAPPPSVPGVTLTSSPGGHLPALFLKAPRPLFAWAAPWSTGPPLQA